MVDVGIKANISLIISEEVWKDIRKTYKSFHTLLAAHQKLSGMLYGWVSSGKYCYYS